MKRAPHELYSPCSKRRLEASSSRFNEAPLCRYRGCDRPCYPKAPGMYYDFCGITHADMHMAEASDQAEYEIIMLDSEPCGDKKCRLPGCENLVANTDAREHDFCCISHMLEYTSLSTAEYRKRGKLCKIEHCFRHVYVENGRCHDFCGLQHAKLAAAAKGAGAKVIRILPEESGEEMNSNSDQDQDSRNHHSNSASQEHQEDEKYRLPPADVFGHTGFDGGIGDQQLKDFLMACQEKLLEELAVGKSSNISLNINIFQGADGAKFRQTNVFQGADIAKFHPWEVVTEPKPRYLLAITSKPKVPRQTRDGWCWKQTGRRYQKHSGLMCKYLSYKGKRGDSSKEQKKDSWTLHEYSLEDDIIRMLAAKKGIDKSDRMKAVILKIARGDNATPGRGGEDDPVSQATSKRSSTTRVPGRSEGVESQSMEQRQASSDCAFFDTFEAYDNLTRPQTEMDLQHMMAYTTSWDLDEPEASWCSLL